jgi:ADP-heptose:LPS heptosyltransferase
MKIAIVQPLGLGDVILSLSIVQTLKRNVPDADVTMVVQQSLAGIPAHHPDVHSVIPIQTDRTAVVRFFKLVTELSEASCDAAIICPGSLSAAMAVAAARIPRRIGSDQTLGMALFRHMIRYPRLQYQTNGAFLIGLLDRCAHGVNRPGIASFLYTDVVPFDAAHHATERFCSLLQPLGIEGHPDHPKIFPSDELAGKFAQRSSDSGIRWDAGPIALVPGSRWLTKRWGEDRYARLAIELTMKYPGKDILICGDSGDKELCDEISASTNTPQVKNISGLLSLTELAGIFRRCSVVVGNDSGAGHYAAAVGTPVVTVFGPTIPGFGFYPLGSKSVVVEGKALDCRPCGPFGGNYCPVKSHECMTSISVESVVNAVEKIIQ